MVFQCFAGPEPKAQAFGSDFGTRMHLLTALLCRLVLGDAVQVSGLRARDPRLGTRGLRNKGLGIRIELLWFGVLVAELRIQGLKMTC